MRFDLSKVEYSKYDLRTNVKVPSHLTQKLAYLSGIHLGDGTMNHYLKYYYSIGYSGHLIDEFEFYTAQFKPLFLSLFHKNLFVYKRIRPGKQSVDLSAQSKAIFTFLTTSLHIPPGPKDNASIPELIKNSKYALSFMKGLADSDFSLMFKKNSKGIHVYPTIFLNSSNSLFLSQVNTLLYRHGFNSHTLFDFPKKRYDKLYISNQLEILGVEQLERWMKKIGFDSPKHLTKYFIWKKFGFCPPYTTLFERQLILKGELDPYSFYQKPFSKSL